MGEIEENGSNLGNSSALSIMSCAIFHGDQHKCDVIVATRCVMASISLVGCIFMITVIWLFRKYLVFAQRLVLCLSVAGMFDNIVYISRLLLSVSFAAMFDSIAYLANGSTAPGSSCTFLAWFTSIMDWCVLMWVCTITFNLYMNAVHMVRTDKYEYVYHGVCWGLPFLISLLPFIGGHYGPAGMWCWIVDNWKWRFGIWYCPLFVFIIALFCTYIYIIVMVKRKIKTWEGLYDPDVERNKLLLKEDVKPLRGYPFVYLVTSVFPLINRIQNAINPGHPVFALVLLHTITSPLQGALNALVFGLDKETAKRLTPTQIKMAFLSRIRNDSLIREYPTPEESGDGPPILTTPSSLPTSDGATNDAIGGSAAAVKCGVAVDGINTTGQSTDA